MTADEAMKTKQMEHIIQCADDYNNHVLACSVCSDSRRPLCKHGAEHLKKFCDCVLEYRTEFDEEDAQATGA